ncbi:hypothetical protein ACFQ27_15555 [Phenylobacterium conjunctum]|uniref:MxaK protein n=1 Tax=Phenylobacterium conjunctum TaxID=1298959 RepID=A0ABW3T490_9CAUL
MPSETSPSGALIEHLTRLGRNLTRRSTALPLSAATIAVVGAVSAFLGLQELDRANAVPHEAFVFRFDVAEDGQAKREVNTALATHDFRRARALAQAALQQNAYNNEARLRLAFIDLAEHGRITPQGLGLVQQSYDLAAYDPTMAGWRVKYVLESWDKCSPGLQKSAVDEARAFLKSGSRVANMREALAQVSNPKGAALAKDILEGLALGTTPPAKTVEIKL